MFSCLPFYKILNNCCPRQYEWELLPKEIASNQLKQAEETCYMVSALESISHIPFLLTYIFEQKFSAKQEKFKVTFKQKNGKSEFYFILNNFPVNKNKELIFMKPLEKEAYAIIFEKVWAVIRGGYMKLNGGKTFDIFNKVLGTSATYLYNDNMKIFDLDANNYIKSKNIPPHLYNDIYQQIQIVKEKDKEYLLSSNDDNKIKINCKESFKLIREAEKNDGALVTASISTDVYKGHAYSILGTYSTINPKNGKMQDFVILKNPWRSGNDIQEKINILSIEKQIDGLNEIILINRRHYETGVFYMPREYFEGWFRNICICKPNYKKYFPKVYEALTLYKVISEYYKIDSGKSFFDSTQGNELIKTDIISKKNLESLKKVIQQINSNYSYVYDKESLSTIWYDGKNNIESSCNYFFVKEDDSFNVKIKKKQEINEDDFNYGQVFSPSISYHNRKDHCYRIIRLNQIDSISEIKPKKLTKNYSIPNFHKEPKIDVIPLLENNKPRYDYINPILGTESNYENPYVERNQNPFLNQLKKDLKHMEKYEDEIKEFLKEKYVFLGEGETENVSDGWIDKSDGIILCSDDYFDNHYFISMEKKIILIYFLL